MAVKAHNLHHLNREFLGAMDNQLMDIFQTQKGAHPDGNPVAGNSTPVDGFQQMKRMRVDGDGDDDGGDVFSLLHHQHKIQIDHIISQHKERIKTELLESKWRFMKQVAATMEGVTLKRIKSKEEEIDQVRQLNATLEERLRCLSVETRIWRDLANANEAAIITLRVNLEQALAQNQLQSVDNANNNIGEGDDAESCCDNYLHEGRDGDHNAGRGGGGGCRVCAKEEPCVLLLPCRHLCLCSSCSMETVVCPICCCTKQCTIHINLP